MSPNRSSYSSYEDDELARLIDDPLFSTSDKLSILKLKDKDELRALRSTLSVPAAGMYDAAQATVETWNPPRSYGYLAQRQTLYPNLTDTPKKRFQLCWDYAGPKGLSFLQSGIDLQAGFACTGFSHRVGKNERAKGYYDKFAEVFNMRTQLFQVFRSLIRYDNAVVIWRKPPKRKYSNQFLEFRVEPIKNVTVDYTGATNDITDDGNLIYLDIDLAHKALIEKLERSTAPEEKKVVEDFKKQFPKLYKIYKSRKSDQKYLLSNRDGEYWAVINFENRGAGLDEPSMESIFGDCEVWKSLQQADLVIASLVKQLVVLVTQGETLNQADTSLAWKMPTDVPNPGWARQADFAKLKTAFAQRLGSILYLFGQHHLKVDFKHPDPQVLGREKYEQSLANILAWLCLGSQFIMGEGGKFQAGEINRTSLTSRLDNLREMATTELRNKVYKHPTININNYAEIPWIIFDRDVLKSPKDAREDLKLDTQVGLSQTEAADRRGFDLERSMELRKAEREKHGEELFNQVDFSGNIKLPGRPVDEENEETQEDNPPRRDEEL